MNELLEKLDKTVLFFLIYTFVFIIFIKTLPFTIPFVLALLCSLILQKPTKFLITKLKFHRAIASLTTTISFFSIIIVLLIFGFATLTSEIIQLGKSVTAFVSDHNDFIMKIPDQLQVLLKNVDPSVVSTVKNQIMNSTSKVERVAEVILKGVGSYLLNMAASIPYILMVIVFTMLATYFFTKDFASAKSKFISILPDSKTDRISYIISETKRMFGNYFLSYMLIIFVTFIETIIVFNVFNVKYAILLSIICGLVDIVPVLGIGFIYIPVAIIYIALHNYFVGLGLIICYVVVVVIRHLIEPKIVSSTLGIHPAAVLAAIFIGLEANGIMGMFFCIFLVVFFNIFRKINVI